MITPSDAAIKYEAEALWNAFAERASAERFVALPKATRAAFIRACADHAARLSAAGEIDRRRSEVKS